MKGIQGREKIPFEEVLVKLKKSDRAPPAIPDLGCKEVSRLWGAAWRTITIALVSHVLLCSY